MACVGTLSNCLAPVRLIPNAFWSFSLSSLLAAAQIAALAYPGGALLAAAACV
jgi:hypothetical protein